MFGDTAVAVHPEDERYRYLIGKRVRVPLTTRAIPVVGDSILVDREFGTGAVKITPAHDFNDFEAGERHALPRIRIMDIHANLHLEGALAESNVVQIVEGLPVAKARPKIEQLLTERGLLEKAEPHKMALGKCYRCKTVVEPLLSDQWFVKIKPLAEPANKPLKMVVSGSFPMPGRTTISVGCETSRTGAFRGKSGGAISSRPGIARPVMEMRFCVDPPMERHSFRPTRP